MCEFQGPQWKINKCFGHFVIQTSFPLCRGSMDQAPKKFFFDFFFFTNYSGFGRSGRSRVIGHIVISLRLGSTRTHMCAHNVPEIPKGPWIKPRKKNFSIFFFLPIIRDSEDPEDLVLLVILLSRFVWVLPVHICV